MMPYQSYQLWQVERTKTVAEQRAGDVRAGEVAAAMSRSFRQAGRLMRAVAIQRPRLGHSGLRLGAPRTARVRASDCVASGPEC